MPLGLLAGRVALTCAHQLVDDATEFYIGESHGEIDGIEVFSWTARISGNFYRGGKDFDLFEDVCTIRRFSGPDGPILDYEDETLRDDAPANPFRKRGLVIPTAPARSVPRPSAPPSKPTAVGDLAPSSASTDAAPAPTPGNPGVPSMSNPESEQAPRRGCKTDRPGDCAPKGLLPVRSESLLRAALEAPRTKSLAPVLATLQPDQYEYVSAPAMSAMIIEGQPGTGKTIIASHRAAYLINEDTPPENSLDNDVLVVGPTPDYSNHVRDLIHRLTGGSERIKVLSLPELMLRITGIKDMRTGEASRSLQDVDRDLGMLVRKAAHWLRANVRRTPAAVEVYEYLRRNGSSAHPVTTAPEWISYLSLLPEYKDAVRRRTQLPLIAFIRWEVDKPRDLSRVEHIIVDEAQDVTPLEWFLLHSINTTEVGWTLLGDLNQRRSDHTLSSWKQVVNDVLALPEDPPVYRLNRGYRSTRAILEYANRLLPARERVVVAFQQSGPAPTLTEVRPKELCTAIASEVDRLVDAYSEGTVAVITPALDAARKGLREDGWAAADTNYRAWRRNDQAVIVIEPDEARGLEFDAVIVAEPHAFKPNFGRKGPLYTSLTRANRELAVVHSQPLSEELRRR